MALFSEFEANLILSLPISHRLPEERLIWHFDKEGLFSVQSAYHIALDLTTGRSNRASSSGESQLSWLWKKVWGSKVPLKVCMNVWRFYKDIIQSKSNLVKRRITTDSQCVLCGNEGETGVHILRDCSFAACVWSFLVLGCLPSGNSPPTFGEWMLSLIPMLDKHTFDLILMHSYAIWTARNSMLWSGKCNPPNVMVPRTISWWRNFQLIFTPTSSPCHFPASPRVKWVKPRLGLLKLNVDGVWNANRLIGGMGGGPQWLGRKFFGRLI